MNIRFEYTYCDAGGNKLYNAIVLRDDTNRSLESIESEIRTALFDSEFFYPYKLNIPLLRFPGNDEELDHDWYCFDGIVPCNEEATEPRLLSVFIADLKQYCKAPPFFLGSISSIRGLDKKIESDR